MRCFALVLLLVAIATFSPVAAEDVAGQDAAKQNVVLIVADDLGLQLGCYGDRVIHSPAIDRLAREGTRFTRAYCSASSCSPSRAEINTGLYSHCMLSYGNEDDWNNAITYDSVLSLPARFAKAGYRTCSIGKHTLIPERLYHFDVYGNARGEVEGRSRNPAAIGAAARRFIESDDDQPFFLYVGTSDPHRGGGASDPSRFANAGSIDGWTPIEYEPAAMVVPAWLPDTAEVRAELAEYYQAVSRFDATVGRLMDVLRETGHYDQTLIILASDNGPPFPGAKTTQYEPGIRLPLIVRSPNQSRRGVTTDAAVSWVDITPTILEFAGIDPDIGPQPQPRSAYAPRHGELHGRSFLGVLDQEHPAGFDTVFGSFSVHDITMYYPMRTMIRGNMKYIWNAAHALPFPMAADLYRSPTWEGVRRRGDSTYGSRTVDAFQRRPRDELYDLAADPNESRNLANDPAYAGTLAAMQRELRAWQKRTKDPWIKKWEHE